MNTKSYRVKVGSPNIVIDKGALEKRARAIGVTENQIEELSLAELDRLVTMKELVAAEED